MHSVIRKRQGLPWAPEEPKGLASNGAHLVGVQVRAGPFGTDDLGLAFGQRAHPKVVKQVVAEDDALRRKALAHVCEQLRYARETAAFLPAGVVPALNQSAEHKEDAETRRLASAALARLSLEGNGRQHMLMDGSSASVPVLLRLVLDAEAAVRANSLTAVLALGKHDDGAAQLIAGGAVKLLLERCTDETGGVDGAELLAAVLAALETCMMHSEAGLAEAIELGGVSTIANLLAQSPSMEVSEHACYCLAALTVGSTEKKAAMAAGCFTTLLTLITRLHGASDESYVMDERVATAATAALMVITVETECKAEATRAGAVKALAPLLRALPQLGPANCTLTANVCKCMANLAEHPHGRKQLKAAALRDLEPLVDSQEPLVQKCAAIAVQKVTWQP
jgi:hypothetical protein